MAQQAGKAAQGEDSTPSIARPDVRLYMQYIGAMTLLGRVARHVPKGDELRAGLDRALHDANNWLLVNDKDIRFERDSAGGWSAFDASLTRPPAAKK